MAITVTLTADSADELSEPLRKVAKEVSGKFVVSGLPEGFAVEDVKGLRSTVQTLRNELNTEKSKLGQQLQPFLDAGLTPEQAKDAADALGRFKAGSLKTNTEIEEFKKAAIEKHTKELASSKAELESAVRELEENLIRGELAPVIAAKGGADAMDAIMTLAKQNIRVVKDQSTGKRRLVVVSPDGSVMTTKKAGSLEPMGCGEFIDGMRESQSLKGLFAVRNTGGSGSSSQSRGAASAANQDSAKPLSGRDLIQSANDAQSARAG